MYSHMRKKVLTLLGLIMWVFLSLASAVNSPYPAAEETERIQKSCDVLRKLMSIPEKNIPQALLEKAYAVVVIPGLIKAAYVIGGQHGKGILIVRSDIDVWSNPLFIKLTGGSIGWQIGFQKADIILVFTSPKGIEDILDGEFTLGAGASIVAGPAGRKAEASTDIELEAEIYSYSRSKGLFAGISLQGAVISVDRDANAEFYRTRDLSARNILIRKDIHSPLVVGKLKDMMKKYIRY
jgi:lipid-binding SYLF domain-containing protein